MNCPGCNRPQEFCRCTSLGRAQQLQVAQQRISELEAETQRLKLDLSGQDVHLRSLQRECGAVQGSLGRGVITPEQLLANVGSATRVVESIIDSANRAGWDGVNNSKFLEVFIATEFENIARLKKALDAAEARAAEAERLLDLERKQRDVFRDKLSMLLPCAEVGDSEDALVSRATEAVRELQEARHRKAAP